MLANEPMDDSDIDLIIEFEGSTDGLFDFKLKLKTEIMNEFNVPVDINPAIKYLSF